MNSVMKTAYEDKKVKKIHKNLKTKLLNNNTTAISIYRSSIQTLLINNYKDIFFSLYILFFLFRKKQQQYNSTKLICTQTLYILLNII